MSTIDVDDIIFEIEFDSFPSRPLEDDEPENLSEKYKLVAKKLLGEDDEKTDELIQELAMKCKEKGIRTPNKRHFYLKFLRAGKIM